MRGVKGRDKPTGVTFLKSWAALDEAVSHIWENARTFNEDGSDISELAGELEVEILLYFVSSFVAHLFKEYFHRRLTEAKRVVAEPPQPRVKLRMPAKSPEPSKITLKFGGQKNAGTPAMSVDSEALKRQQELVRAGANGHATMTGRLSNQASNAVEDLRIGIGSSTIPALGRPFNEKGAPGSQVPNGLKAEGNHRQSPALSSIQLNDTNEARQSPTAGGTHMPPPVNMSTRLSSGSPHPHAITNGVTSASNSSNTPFNSRLRQPGKGEICVLNISFNFR